MKDDKTYYETVARETREKINSINSKIAELTKEAKNLEEMERVCIEKCGSIATLDLEGLMNLKAGEHVQTNVLGAKVFDQKDFWYLGFAGNAFWFVFRYDMRFVMRGIPASVVTEGFERKDSFCINDVQMHNPLYNEGMVYTVNDYQNNHRKWMCIDYNLFELCTSLINKAVMSGTYKSDNTSTFEIHEMTEKRYYDEKIIVNDKYNLYNKVCRKGSISQM